MYYKFQQSSSLRRKPLTVDVVIINENGQQIQVCNLLISKTKYVAWLNWHVAGHLTKKIEISLKKVCKCHPKMFWGVGNSAYLMSYLYIIYAYFSKC